MPKKPPPTGYFYFMLEFRAREERFGRRFPGGLKDVATAASEDWRNLSPAEKERYNKIAKERKHDPRPNIPNPDEKRFNCQGVSFAQIAREKEQKERKITEINKFVANFVNEMDLETLKNRMLYLIHVNFFCKTDNNVYYPAEIAIVKFNLKFGPRGIYHRFIDPGEIATGYSFAVKEHSEATHKITLQHVKTAENAKDMPRMYNEICDFLQESENDDTIPPLFTMYDDEVFQNTSETAVKKTLKRLWESVYSHCEDDDSWEKVFKVYPLPPMFCKLKNRCYNFVDPDVEAFPNSVLAANELKKDAYDFYENTACNYHQTEDAVAFCSKAYVLKWSFIIRDNCCDSLGINILDQHKRFDKLMQKSEGSIYEDCKDDDCKSVYSDYSVSTQCTERSTGFSAAISKVKEENNFKYASQPVKKEPVQFEREEDECKSETSQSVKSCPVVWPQQSRKKESAPLFTDVNFPGLGFGRGSMRDLKAKMEKMNLEK